MGFAAGGSPFPGLFQSRRMNPLCISVVWWTANLVSGCPRLADPAVAGGKPQHRDINSLGLPEIQLVGSE
jgi:hypothetical protein